MNRVYVSIFTSLIVAASCGDNAPNNASPDAQGTSGPIAVAVASVYGTPTGILSKLDVDALMMQTNLAAGVVKGDPVLRRIGDTLYIVNRDVNSITMLDARTLVPIDEVAVGAAGENQNPQDVAVVGNKLFVPALENAAGVVVLTRSSTERTTIDLTNALECKGECLPRCVSAYAIGNDVYVACGLLTKSFMPTGNGKGKVAVIDATSNAVRVVVEMPVPNPQNLFVRTPTNSAFGGDLLIPTLEYNAVTNVSNGNVVRVSPGPSPTASIAIPSSDLQGAPSHIEVLEGNPSLLVLAAAQEYGKGQLRAFDLDSNQLWSGSLSPSTQNITDVAACPDGKFVVSDASADGGGLRVYSGAEAEVTSTALPIGLPPGAGNQVVCYNP